MAESDWLEVGPVRELVRRIADKAVEDYRVESDRAMAVIVEALAGNEKLKALAARETSLEGIARTRVYRDAARDARRQVYYSLRRYRQDDEQFQASVERLGALPTDACKADEEELVRAIASAHASTRERLPVADDFHRQLFTLAGQPKTILDVGCGVHPLIFPFDGRGLQVETYLGIDKDPAAIRAVDAYAARRAGKGLKALRWDLKDGWDPVRTASGIEVFDLALLLKVVPVISRQAPRLLTMLAATPAKRLLVTGSRVSMAKHQDIERRERAILRRFLENAGLQLCGEIDAGEEFGWMATRV